ncbi:N-acetyl-gamma-glutamyl-phosphate reductase [Streptomyces sp. BA2]|uniref:N-acetyl-gamma-glutamyl-phosphate reductase n=1 Tax=Streptomyces sp. BA2 TaxID=436595 RepID=UPI001325B6F3|nr:N-acetyl-gamma-glutamyl-phosphate reductase [Streptomyces sp. BA2]MWA08346.1 N-acetyl-gamma-glutamyl-phosphate reductase [Streptomyces sp. BA2]
MIRAGVIGASGLVGGELIRLLTQHPGMKLTFLGGNSSVGMHPGDLHPGLRLNPHLSVQHVTADTADQLDVAFLATPGPVSAELAALLADRIPAVIDLSGAFRIRNRQLHDRWYPNVQRRADLVDRFVYGVPELVGEQMNDAALITLPGCYATAITLGLAPLILGMGLQVSRVLVDAKGGSSGSGLRLRTTGLHPLRSGAITPYAPTGHRHAAEVTDFLQRTRPGSIGSLSMSAYGVATVRGLLVSLYVWADRTVGRQELERAYLRFYRGHPFVRPRRHTETRIPMPDPQAVLGSNFCDVTALVDEDGGHIVVLAALDNLVKGAAGQAVQAANRRFDLPEETGLTMQPVMPA